MMIPLLLGCAAVFVTMGIQIATLVFMLQYLYRALAGTRDHDFSKSRTTYVISMVTMTLFAGHLLQVAIWAGLFVRLGEFDDFRTAFYHSMVNFASLGYGDIVMSERWRLLGALEASNGVLMFGVTAGVMLSVMTRILSRDERVSQHIKSLVMNDRHQ
jgi:Ion channel